MPHHRGGGARGVGGWGGALGGWGIRRISCTYAYIHTCWYQDYGRENKKKKNYQIEQFSIISPAKWIKNLRTVDEIGLGLIYPILFPQIKVIQ